MSYIYLASPYTHEDPDVEADRYFDASRFVGEWARRGVTLYSPVCHFHLPARMCELSGAFDFWREANTTMLRHASELWVYQLSGWDRSKGVLFEIDLAQKLCLPIKYHEGLPGWKEKTDAESL